MSGKAQPTPPAVTSSKPGSPSTPATPGAIVTLADFETAARPLLSPMAWAYIAGGAADEITLAWNREAYNRLRLRPRVLVDVSRLDTRTALFGQELASPVLLAPAAYQRIVHPEGEVATARAAAAASAIFVVSSFATTAIEDIAASAPAPLWFQLYVQRDREFTRDLVQRAEAAGCRALCVTVDTPVVGARNREQRTRFALPPGMDLPNLRGLRGVRSGHTPDASELYSQMLNASLSWKDLGWLRSLSKLPLVLKGILDADDAARAVQEGADGVIVSNHGARNLDTVPATIEALPQVVERVAGAVPVLVDGGIRRGTDVLKALALGAKAVLIGRPYLYGLAAGGEDGVHRVLAILQQELQMAMALTGRPRLAEIERSVLWPEGR